eukprot:TRINITY_DN48372_c0_g1_i1.p1 TRINITY_DN48372_c0_g1~~TRINITY_DN48372_c0_g1_i1.p1  ORF type:complete len:241 (+),score=83.60 TRINITY_DN48372_c0_g1_i1:77-724(+)
MSWLAEPPKKSTHYSLTAEGNVNDKKAMKKQRSQIGSRKYEPPPEAKEKAEELKQKRLNEWKRLQVEAAELRKQAIRDGEAILPGKKRSAAGGPPPPKRRRQSSSPERQQRPVLGSKVSLKPGFQGDPQGSLTPGAVGTVVRDIWAERGVPEYVVETSKGKYLYHENNLVVASSAAVAKAKAEGKLAAAAKPGKQPGGRYSGGDFDSDDADQAEA